MRENDTFGRGDTMGDADINIDEMIARLLEVRNNRPGKGTVLLNFKNSDLKNFESKSTRFH